MIQNFENDEGFGPWAAIVEGVGEQEADRLVVGEFGTAQAVYDHLAAVGSIEEEAE